jgi:hypothetical protein
MWIELENLAAPRRMYLESSRVIVPGQEVSVRYEPPSDPGPAGYGLNVYFRDRVAKTTRRWANSGSDLDLRFTPDVTPIRSGAGGTLRFRVPEDAPLGQGELLVNGEMYVKVLRCQGASSCGARAVVNAAFDVEVTSAFP